MKVRVSSPNVAKIKIKMTEVNLDVTSYLEEFS